MDTTTTYTDRKFIARVKNSPYFLLLTWVKIPSEDIHAVSQHYVSFTYQMPDPDLGNISMYSAKNILEEDICYAALEGLDVREVEIVEVGITYTFKN